MRNFLAVIAAITLLPVTWLAGVALIVGAIGTILSFVGLFFLPFPRVFGFWIWTVVLMGVGYGVLKLKLWLLRRIAG